MLVRNFSKDIKKRRAFKTPYLGNNTWRQIFLHLSSQVIEEQDKFVHDRASTISPVLVSSKLKIHMGRGYISRYINPFMVGFKFGEFT